MVLTVVYEVHADSFPPSVKETIAMDLEKFGNRVQCVSVTANGNEQIAMDAWQNKRN